MKNTHVNQARNYVMLICINLNFRVLKTINFANGKLFKLYVSKKNVLVNSNIRFLVLFYRSLKFNQRYNFGLDPRLRKRNLTKQ